MPWNICLTVLYSLAPPAVHVALCASEHLSTTRKVQLSREKSWCIQVVDSSAFKHCWFISPAVKYLFLLSHSHLWTNRDCRLFKQTCRTCLSKAKLGLWVEITPLDCLQLFENPPASLTKQRSPIKVEKWCNVAQKLSSTLLSSQHGCCHKISSLHVHNSLVGWKFCMFF